MIVRYNIFRAVKNQALPCTAKYGSRSVKWFLYAGKIFDGTFYSLPSTMDYLPLSYDSAWCEIKWDSSVSGLFISG